MNAELIHRILCPVDFSSASTHALRYAERLAAQTGSDLVLVHAFDRPKTYDGPGQKTPADPHVKEKLDAVEVAASGVQVSRILHAGEPGEVIPWVAQEENCDVIVMGTHGRSALAHMLLGSVSEHVLRHARCPVLMIRERPDTESPLAEPRVERLPPPSLM